MGALFGKLDDFEIVSWLCGGCALTSALFLVCVIAGAIVCGMRRDRPPPSD